MATQAKKIQTLVVSLEAKPGSLARVYGAFKEASVNVHASWAYEMGPGEAQAIFYPADLGKCKDVLTQLGLKPQTGQACQIEGEDRVGVYSDALQKVAQAGVNLHATDAFGVGGRFAACLFAEDKDIPALCKALGC